MSEPLPIFIPTKGRPRTINTHLVFPDAKIVVHNDDERSVYLANPTIDPSRVYVSGVPTPPDLSGLVRQREWIARNLAPKGRWFVFADDDILTLTAVADPLYRSAELDVQHGDQRRWAAVFDTPCSPERFQEIATETIEYAERWGARLCGFALVRNHFFRATKLRPVGYAEGTLTLQKNDGLTFDPECGREDIRTTADHLLRFGAVVVNNYVFPIQLPHYSKGGLGTYAERVEVNRRSVQKLLGRYSGLLRVRDAKGFEPRTDVCLRLHTHEQVRKWRLRKILS